MEDEDREYLEGGGKGGGGVHKKGSLGKKCDAPNSA